MADQVNLFATEPAPAQQEPVQQPVQQPAPVAAPQLSPEVAAFVGEGRKYANINSALASIPHAQQHIATLEAEKAALVQENERLKGELASAKNLEDVLAKISGNPQPAQDTPIPSGLDEQAVLNLLEQRDAKARSMANQVAVTNALVGKFGDDAKALEALKAKAAELGVGFDFMQDLAAKSPKAVLSYFNVESKPTPIVPHATQTTAQYQTPPEPQLTFAVGNSGNSSDLVNAFRACGIAVNGGQEISHNY